MSNIDRRYAYLDEGVFPAEGEYGVTYLTMYSSNAGNVYDGWVYDPDNKIEESSIPRTYGYRNPDYQQYCWDDEVVVDLSNAQNRQESSESVQGRITSFNTNVSSSPIILQDIDITGLTEEERENKATVVLFSAIPIVKDAYIQAQIEVQCKCNLSPDNTSGEMRIEAFYILNDESDRTMRPNPVHTFTVSSPNERHTLPWIYWNPALKHEDNNYIGVKLIATGGTAEIGISDDPDYGDAIITLASGGLNGDIIYSGHPVSLEIFGKEEVIGGYVLNPDDYTVLCTYDTGEIYEVTRMCDFNPAMGTKIENAFTTLTAYYQGLNASMTIRLGMIESIELFGVDTFHNKLKLELKDYTVFAYLDNGDVLEVTGECVFSPPMGTTITSNTTLTATYTPYWMHGISFTDSMNIEKIAVVATGTNSSDPDGLKYTLYADDVVVITGNATHTSTSTGEPEHEIICLPRNGTTPGGTSINMRNEIKTSGYTLEWDAEGKVGGFLSIASVRETGSISDPSFEDWFYLCKGFVNFQDVQLTRYVEVSNPEWDNPRYGSIWLNFACERDLTSSMLSWLANVDDHPIFSNYNIQSGEYILKTNRMFYACRALQNVNFMKNWKYSNYSPVDTQEMFKYCVSFNDGSGLSSLDMSKVTTAQLMFAGCAQLKTVSWSAYWNVENLEDGSMMFAGCESLVNPDAFWFWTPNKLFDLEGMFEGCGFDHASFLKVWDKTSWRRINNILSGTKIIDLDGLQGLNFATLEQPSGLRPNMFYIANCSELKNLNGCEDWILAEGYGECRYAISFYNSEKLDDISAVSEWDASKLRYTNLMFFGCKSLTDISPISGWDVSNIKEYVSMFAYDESLEDLTPIAVWITSSAERMAGMFSGDDKVRSIACLSGWDVSNLIVDVDNSGVRGMFARSDADKDNDFVNTHIIDADQLNWNVPKTTLSGGVEPYWICTWFNNVSYGQPDHSDMFYGTSWPDSNDGHGHYINMPLSEKLYPLPFWYYHNANYIDETR